MHTSLILDMAADGLGDRPAVTEPGGSITYAELRERSQRLASALTGEGSVGLIDVNSSAVAELLFAAGLAGRPFLPFNYRLDDGHLAMLIARSAPMTVFVGADHRPRAEGIDGVDVVDASERHTLEPAADGISAFPDADGVAALLFTSGTTGEPKAAVLRHRNLAAYVLSTVEFASAGASEATLVSVPPYHIAGISVVLTSVYAGRRLVYLPAFDPATWVDTVEREAVTHAMVVPTMLDRIVDEMQRTGRSLPSLRHMSYGGGRMPVPVLERAMSVLPHVDFVNAYGLTETSSTIAVLTPDDHRIAIASSDPVVRQRLGSVGRPLPSVQVEVRDPIGEAVGSGERGEIWVRGEQVSGEYLGQRAISADGWFPTRDAGHLDADGYLYVEGRLDDVIVRGAENLSPGEIEDVLREHPAVDDVAVVGIPDDEWGEVPAAVVVLREGAACDAAELQQFVRGQLRSARTPAVVSFVTELPYNDMGKLLRRRLRPMLEQPSR